jgi:hypothetical protein
MSLEFVDVKPTGNRYQIYEGSPVRETTSLKSRMNQRAAYIVSLRAARLCLNKNFSDRHLLVV